MDRGGRTSSGCAVRVDELQMAERPRGGRMMSCDYDWCRRKVVVTVYSEVLPSRSEPSAHAHCESQSVRWAPPSVPIPHPLGAPA